MILTLKYLPKTYDVLKDLTKPKTGLQPESLPWVFYDTQTYLAAGSTRLTYFGNAGQTDLTMSNLGNGTLETDQYFEMQRGFLAFLAALSITTTAVVTGAANDIDILHKAARGTWTFQMLQKIVGPFPVEFFGRAGGVTFAGTSEGSETAPARNIIQSGETVMNGGFPVMGAIVVPPVTACRVFLDFNSTAISTNMNIRASLMGVFHRRVA